MSAQTLRLAFPLPEDPADDPAMDFVATAMQETAEDMAGQAGLTAGPVRFVEVSPGLYDGAGHYACNKDGVPLSPRLAHFVCECVP